MECDPVLPHYGVRPIGKNMIRDATLVDVSSIAGIIVSVWQNAYEGIIDPNFPKSLSTERFNRIFYNNIRNRYVRNPNRIERHTLYYSPQIYTIRISDKTSHVFCSFFSCFYGGVLCHQCIVRRVIELLGRNSDSTRYRRCYRTVHIHSYASVCHSDLQKQPLPWTLSVLFPH